MYIGLLISLPHRCITTISENSSKSLQGISNNEKEKNRSDLVPAPQTLTDVKLLQCAYSYIQPDALIVCVDKNESEKPSTQQHQKAKNPTRLMY